MAGDADRLAVPSRRRRRRAWRILAFLFLMGILAAAAGLYIHVANPERVRLAAEDYLRRYFAGPVHIGAAEFSWRDGVRLLRLSVGPAGEGVGVDSPRTQDADASRVGSKLARPVFNCREIRLRAEPLAALLGELRIRSITAIEPTLDVVRETGSDRTNLAGLLHAAFPVVQPSHVPLPTVEFRDATVRLGLHDASGERPVGGVMVSARALPTDDGSSSYDVVWRSDGADGHSRFDLRTGSVSHVAGGLPPMPVELALLALRRQAPGVVAWADEFGLSGRVVVSDFDLPAPGSGDRKTLAIDLTEVSASIPIDDGERGLPPEDRYGRIEGVSGRIRLIEGEIRAALTGRLRGSDCAMALTVRSGATAGSFPSFRDAAVEGRLTVRRMELPGLDPADAPGEARLIRRLDSLTELYAQADPRGYADIDLTFHKAAGADEHLAIKQATVTLDGVEGSIRSLPLAPPTRGDATPTRFTDASGSIEYDGSSVSLRGLRARFGATLVTLEGRLDAPTRFAAAHATIRAEDVRIDDEFWASVPPAIRAERAKLDATGGLDVTVELDRPAGTPDAPGSWSARANARLRDVSMTFAEFPYPLNQLTGTIEFEGGTLNLKDVRGLAGPGSVQVDGTMSIDATPPTRGDATVSPTAMDLTVHGRGLVFDGRLLAALPSATRAFVEPFHPAGLFNLSAKLSLDPATRALRHQSVVTLDGMSMYYARFPVPLTDMMGRLTVTPGEVFVEGVTGSYGEARFSIDGTIARKDAIGATVLQIHGRDITLDGPLRAALPTRVREGLTDWTIEGPLTADTILSSRASGEPGLAIRTSARLEGGRVTHPFFPIPFERVVAQTSVDDTGFRAEGVTARYGAADMDATIDVEPDGESAGGVIVLNATNVVLDQSIRGLGHGRLADEWDRLKPTGVADVHISELRFGPAGPDGARPWTVSGFSDFRDAAFAGVADAKRATGSLLAAGTLVDAKGSASLSGRLALTEAELLGQRVTQTDGEWSFARRADGEGVVALRHGQGRIYGGSWSAHADVHFGSGAVDYDLKTTLQRVSIGPLLNTETAAFLPDTGPVEVEGFASGSLCLSGVVGKPATRRGSGGVQISEGSMYRLPLILAILDVLQLSVPEKDAFNAARAGFLIDGNRIQLDGIRLEGKAMALEGTGTMNWPDRGVDLSLINVGSGRWGRVPLLSDVLEGAAGEVVELHVTGPIYQPKVKARTFRGVTEEIKRLFQKKEPKTIRPSS